MINLLLAVIYLSFISLGLPDSLLGSAWPSMYQGFSVPISYSGIISMIISLGTIVSSLQSDRLTKKFGAGRITAVSVALTAAALIGFSLSDSFFLLCLLSIPYGLGAGSVDAALNNYVALHFASRHMSWLHCMWGVGASLGPYVMGNALASGSGWQSGYRIIGLMQVALSVILFLSLPLWKKSSDTAMTSESAADSLTPEKAAADSLTPDKKDNNDVKLKNQNVPSCSTAEGTDEEIRGTMDIGAGALSLRQVFAIPGSKSLITAFFCYMALEATASLWASSYLNLERGFSAEEAASLSGLFFIGITAGRAISGFVTMKLNDTIMIRLGQSIIAAGLLLLLLPLGSKASILGLILLGLGCAPIYPCIIHSTPEHFGAEKSQAVIGVQMASAYVGSCFTPPFFGLLGSHISFSLYPGFLLLILVLMVIMHESLIHATEKNAR